MVPALSKQDAPLVELEWPGHLQTPVWVQLAGLTVLSLEDPSSSRGSLCCPLQAHC